MVSNELSMSERSVANSNFEPNAAKWLGLFHSLQKRIDFSCDWQGLPLYLVGDVNKVRVRVIKEVEDGRQTSEVFRF
ncbi:MAG: hypothetical protein OXI05_06750 [Bacteroidota bacterium]|nr:hypothetical protein [Bacteroidota bacterium]